MIRSTKIVHTELPPCAISNYENGIVVGTYDLNKETGNRSGSLDVYNAELELISRTSTASSVLDTKVINGKLYSAHSTGEVRVFEQMQQTGCIQLTDKETLVTQIDISDNQLSAVLTNGELCVYDLNKQVETYRSKIHSLEAWTVKNNSGVVFTGGDDRVLSCTDLRMPLELWKLKPHEAGVTSILPVNENTLFTGGYDDHLNTFDLRLRKVVTSSNLEGGVWRLIPNSKNDKIMACCMYAGVKTLSLNGDVLGTLTNNESMVYGGAWLSNTKGVTCSFYDKMLQIWDIND